MTQLAIGQAKTISVGDGGTVTISTNGGFGRYSGTSALGQAFSRSFGPEPYRHTIGPSKEGFSVTITNDSVNWLDYDAGPVSVPVLDAAASVSGKPLKVLWVGDSFGQRSNIGSAVTAATVSNGVMTLTIPTGHGLGTGQPASLAGAAVAACMFQAQPVVRVDANTLRVVVAGAPDGDVAISSAARSGLTLVRHGQFSEEGTFVNLQRRSGYAFEMVRNVSQPGYTVAEIVALWDQLVTPLLPSSDLVVFEAGYNSLAQSESADIIIAAYESAIKKTTKPLYITAPWPVVSSSGAASATKLQTALSAYWRLKALCEASNNAFFIDTFSGTVNPSDGFVQSGYMGADNIHKSARGSDYAALALLSRISASARPARTLVASGLDSIATDASNANVARNGLALTVTGGTIGPFAMGVPADEATGTAGPTPPLNWTFAQNAGSPTGQVFYKPTTAGNAVCARITGVATANQARSSFGLTAADFVAGGTLDVGFSMKLRTDFNASNKTPAGQNVRGLIVQLVLTVDAVAYTWLLSNQQPTPSAGIYLTSDIDTVVYAKGLVIPSGVLTSPRIDFNLVFDGAGVAQIEIGQISVRKV